jgi:hypothetical protein
MSSAAAFDEQAGMLMEGLFRTARGARVGSCDGSGGLVKDGP